ncbi:MAG: MBL fold metallo-hydrolase [Bacillota bacterium]
MKSSCQPCISSIPVADGVTLVKVELDPQVEGFQGFITPWVLIQGHPRKGPVFVVDPGPAVTIPQLLQALAQMGVERVHYVLLTHVHIDHAGGTAILLRQYPEARVVAHHQGHQHLVDPTRLWEGSVKTLGSLAISYGQIDPIPPHSLARAEELPAPLTVVPTPGHAPHHQSYIFRHGASAVMFAGEAAGIFIDDGCAYLRPATPPRFFLEVTLSSLEQLMKLGASLICYGHCGFSRHPEHLMAMHRQQLLLWREVIQEQLDLNTQASAPEIQTLLLRRDPLLAGYFALDPALKKREDYFFDNSVKGFLQYLQAKGA